MLDYSYYIVVSTDVAGTDFVHYCDTLEDAQSYARWHSKCGHIEKCRIYSLLQGISHPNR